MKMADGKSEKRSDEALAWRRFYKTAVWERRRFEQLQKEPYCRFCMASGIREVAVVADHVIPHKGNWRLFCLGELQSLCNPCHSSRKQAEERAGFSRAVGPDGLPLDPKHPAYR